MTHRDTAQRSLELRVAGDPDDAVAHYRLGRAADALPCFVTARRLDPRNQTVDVYVPSLLTAFIRPSNYLWSWLSDEAERIRNSLSKGRKGRRMRTELKECEAMSDALRREFRASRVPRALRSLAAAAARLGIGDDVCRPVLMRRMPRTERTKLMRQVDALAAEVSAWLDSFSTGRMSTEAAAFMYLMESTDELRRDVSRRARSAV